MISILQGLEMGWKGLTTGSRGLKIMKKGSQMLNKVFAQKSKVPKWVCRSPLASFRSGSPFFAIFDPARGQIFQKVAVSIAFRRFLPSFTLGVGLCLEHLAEA